MGKFNKSADRFFTAKKEVIDTEINTANDLLNKLKNSQISVNEATDELQNLNHINKSKEFDLLKKRFLLRKKFFNRY